jgi:hypothetical protein
MKKFIFVFMVSLIPLLSHGMGAAKIEVAGLEYTKEVEGKKVVKRGMHNLDLVLSNENSEIKKLGTLDPLQKDCLLRQVEELKKVREEMELELGVLGLGEKIKIQFNSLPSSMKIERSMWSPDNFSSQLVLTPVTVIGVDFATRKRSRACFEVKAKEIKQMILDAIKKDSEENQPAPQEEMPI